LGEKQAGRDLPLPTAGEGLDPLPKVCRQGVEVEGQTIAGKHRLVAGREPLGEFMDQLVSHRLGVRAQPKCWDNAYAGAGITRHPQPGGFGHASHFEAQFVELYMSQMERT
jgi:hypothetical protein